MEEIVEPGFISEYVYPRILCFAGKVFLIVTCSIIFKIDQVTLGYFILAASSSRTLVPRYKKFHMAKAGYNIGSSRSYHFLIFFGELGHTLVSLIIFGMLSIGILITKNLVNIPRWLNFCETSPQKVLSSSNIHE